MGDFGPDGWITSLNEVVAEEKRRSVSAMQLMQNVRRRGYIISYPRIFREVYCGGLL